MLGKNTTGRPDNKDYLLGRACIYVAQLDATTGLPGAYRPIGNCPNFSLSLDINELTHRTSLCTFFGGAATDRRLIITQTINLNMVLEELNHENFAIFSSGTVDQVANPAVAGIAESLLTDNLELYNWYPLSDSSSGYRALMIDRAKLTLESPNNTALTDVTDYDVDEEAGMVAFFPDGPNTLTAGDDVYFSLASDAGAPAYIQHVNALAAAQIRYAVKVILENANNENEISELEFHSVNLTGDGDLGLISDELAQMTLTGVAEANQNITGSPTLTISFPTN